MGTTAEKGAYLNTTKSLLKQKINNLGGSIDDNTTFRQYANQLQNVYDNLPKTEYQEGTEITLSNTLKGKLDFEKIYQEVEYITNTNGTEYINTGFMPDQDTRVVLDFENQTTIASFICGARNGAGINGFGLLVASDTAFRSDYANNLGIITIPSTLGRFIIDKNKNITTVTKNGEAIGSYSDNYTTFAPTQDFYLFNNNNNGATSSPVALIKLYSCKIFNNEVLVREFIPCYRKSDGVIGMYDKVQDKFYTNSGTGTFAKGADIGDGFGDIVGYGQAEQKSYEGYNLLEPNFESYSSNNVTLTNNNNGTYTLNGTASADTNFVFKRNWTLESNTQYRVSGCPSGGSADKYFIYGVNFSSFPNETGSGVEVTTGTSAVTMAFRIKSGVNVSGLILKPMVTKGTTQKTFEPYVGGTASPNPSYPQDIEVVRGKNILPNNATSRTLNGLTFTKYEDGSVLVNGTATANTQYDLLLASENKKISSGDYYISGCPSGGTAETYRLVIGVNGTLYGEYGSGRAVTLASGVLNSYIYIQNGATVTNKLYKPMLEQGSQATPYLPYNTIEEVVSGKNLYNDNAETEAYYYNASGEKVASPSADETYINLEYNLSDTAITISRATRVGGANIRICEYNGTTFIKRTLTTAVSETITLDSNTTRVIFSINKSETMYFTNLMIEQGSTATTYEPYQTPQTYQLSLGEYEFAGIGNYVDTIEYDVDEDKVYKNENIVKQVVTGTFLDNLYTFMLQSINSYGIANFLLQYISNSEEALYDFAGLCNYLSTQTSSIANEQNEGILYQQRAVYIRIKSTTASTTQEFKTYVNSLNTGGNPLIIYRQLLTPTKTQITGTLKDQIKALYYSHSFTGTTIITSNGDLPMIIKVRALKS